MEIYVSQKEEHSGDGSYFHPFKTISEAAKIAKEGDIVNVAPGIYREWVKPAFSGTKNNPIIYRSTKYHGAVISGAEIVDNLQKLDVKTFPDTISDINNNTNKSEYRYSKDYIYKKEIPDSSIINENSFQRLISIEEKRHAINLYIGDDELRKVYSINEILNPIPEDYKNLKGVWFTLKENIATVIYIRFLENIENIPLEMTFRNNCFSPVKEGIDYITIQGFVLEKTSYGDTSYNSKKNAAVNPNNSKGWCIEDCEIKNNMCCGISLDIYNNEDNTSTLSTCFKKSPAQIKLENIMKVEHSIWNKSAVGSHIIKRCEIHNCLHAGISGDFGAIFSKIEDNHIYNINKGNLSLKKDTAAIKLSATVDTTIRRNHIENNARGIWIDYSAQGCRINQNILHDNYSYENKDYSSSLQFGEDLYLSHIHGPILIDNNVMLSPFSARLNSDGYAFVHNLIAGAFTYVGNKNKTIFSNFNDINISPYHMPHETVIRGFGPILHGDCRFYNNLFVQTKANEKLMSIAHSCEFDNTKKLNFSVGLQVYNEFPTPEAFWPQKSTSKNSSFLYDYYNEFLPVYTYGNFYLGGANHFSKEKNFFHDIQQVYIKLFTENEILIMETNAYENLPDTICYSISSKELGNTIESEAPFENTDKETIDLRKDFFENTRTVGYCLPGPFASKNTIYKLFKTNNENGYEASATKINDINDNTSTAESNSVTNDINLEEEKLPRILHADLMVTGCENISFPFEKTMVRVKEVFICGNILYIHFDTTNDLIEIDLKYGFYHHISPKWSIKVLQAMDASDNENINIFIRTIGTLLSILSRSMTHDPQDACSKISDKLQPVLDKYGITMRLTPNYMKFIFEKKFITFQDVIYKIHRKPLDIVTDIFECE